MEELSPQGALLALCVSRLPGHTLPRHAWAAEVLVEQLWAYTAERAEGDGWLDVLVPLVGSRGVDARRVRAEVWALAQEGALVPVGVGAAARYEVAEDLRCTAICSALTPEQDRVVDLAVDQLTARLLAFSKTASAC
ncbi:MULTISPECIES: hypothetical protein [unclassified Streptomyces]|uniref:hypothetical protein n=1 Tax=unclassified Streptomyces TaxID=2593676 RepID=UPI00114D65D6|nr:hypothetical protein [Streptomyces sp. SLBN-115]TQJ55990.1 hypothetical protein FBY34_3805 [Streptomyces sp. SLBN-115]